MPVTVGEAAKRVEQEAVEYVLRWEKRQGRNPKAVSRQGPDVISGRRKIEVKGKGGEVWERSLIRPQAFKKLRESRDSYLYVVTNINSEDRRKYGLYILKLSEPNIKEYVGQWEGPFCVKVPKKERERYRVK
jgi:hypothetical protein